MQLESICSFQMYEVILQRQTMDNALFSGVINTQDLDCDKFDDDDVVSVNIQDLDDDNGGCEYTVHRLSW